ncbi:DUF2079 domain-containing protein [Synechococcus sp. Cu2B8-bc1011]|uniref:DUF2079 domain-containing protein n=1 Tax=Synechococcus sp. Cu2B8-bc1011 TaxID=3093725 RepID=UPI0039B057F5
MLLWLETLVVWLPWLVNHPLIYRNPLEQLNHGRSALRLINTIPNGSSVAATTGLIPHLANREVLIRFPYNIHYQDQSGQQFPVDWVVADLHNQRMFQTFIKQRKGLERNLRQLNDLIGQDYGVFAFDDDVVLLQRQTTGDASQQKDFERFAEALNL